MWVDVWRPTTGMVWVGVCMVMRATQCRYVYNECSIRHRVDWWQGIINNLTRKGHGNAKQE